MGNLLKRALLLLAIVIAGIVPAWGQCNPTIQTCVNLATDTTGTLPVASLPASVVQTTGDATFGAHTYDFSGVTLIKLKIGAGYTTTTSGVIGYDSSANLWRFGQNGVAITLPQAAGAISHQWLISYTAGTGAFTQGQPSFTDIAGVLGSGQCPNPGASSLGCTQSLAVVSHNFLTGISTGGVVTQAQPAYSDISGTPTLYNQTIVDGAGTTATQQPIFKFINGTNMTIVCVNNGGATRTDCTFTSSATAATAFSSLTASTNSNAGNFIVSGGNWDFSGGTWKAPIGAAYAPTASGVFGYDSTANGYVFGQNGATIRYSLSSSACSTHQFVNVPATNAAAAICAQPAYSDISGTPTLYNQTIDANGTSKPQEPILNLISGSGATVSCADNPGATRTDCTVAATGTGTVTPTGSPASPNLTCFSGATSITNCNLSGDAMTSGAAVVTVPKVNGVSYGASPSTNTVPVVTGANTVTYEAVPNAALANSSVSINSVTATLGANCTTCAASLNLANTTLMTTLGDVIYGGASGLPTRQASPTVNGIYDYIWNVTGGVAVAPGPALVGLGGRAVTGATATATIATADCTTVVDHDVAGSAAVTVTLPTATTLGNSSCSFVYSNHSAQADSIVPTTWTIQSANTAAGSSLSVPAGAFVRIKVDTNSATNWLADLTNPNGGNGGGTTVAAGTCTMSSATTCPSFNLSASVASPICDAQDQTGFIVGHCTVSGTAITVTAASSNSDVWNVRVVPTGGITGGGGGTGSTYTYVASATGASTIGPVNLSYSPTAGHFLIVDFFVSAASMLSGNTFSVTDNQSDPFTVAKLDTTSIGATQPFGEYYLYNVSAGVTTITVNSSGGTGTPGVLNMIVREYACSGPCAGPDQISSVGTGTGTVFTAGSITPTVTNSLVSTFFFQNQSQAISSSSPFTARKDAGDGTDGIGVLDDIVSSNSGIAGKASVSGSATWHGYTINYK